MTERVPTSTYTVPVPEDKAGTRLDRLLADALPTLSRSRLKALIKAGLVEAAGRGPLVEPAYRVKAADSFAVTVPAPIPALPRPQDIPLDVVYEDRDLIVLDKAAGMTVHPGAGNPDRTLVNALLAHCRGGLSGIGGVSRPGIVHRLDKGTSGLMVAAKNDLAHRGLAAQFAERTVERAYKAVVWGVPRRRRGEIAGNIGRSPANRRKMAVLAEGGRLALTRYLVVEPLGTRASLVECRLATGRTHQIRVHMASLGHPVVGDPLYGGGGRRLAGASEPLKQAVAGLNGQALYAYVIGFKHPISGKMLRFECQWPLSFSVLTSCLDIM